MLLALEGIAGAGKSTLRNHVLAAAQDDGVAVGHVGQFSWLSLEATRSIVALRAGRRVDSTKAVQASLHDLELHSRHNLASAMSAGSVIADRLSLSTACLLALVYGGSVAAYVEVLAQAAAARPHLTVLLTTPPSICQSRITGRATARRFGEDLPTALRLAELYEDAATAWTQVTGLPVLRHPCATENDLAHLVIACLDQLRNAEEEVDHAVTPAASRRLGS